MIYGKGVNSIDNRLGELCWGVPIEGEEQHSNVKIDSKRDIKQLDLVAIFITTLEVVYDWDPGDCLMVNENFLRDNIIVENMEKEIDENSGEIKEDFERIDNIYFTVDLDSVHKIIGCN